MPTKTKTPATIDDLLAPKPTPINLDQHKEDLARRAKEAEERCSLEEKLLLCNPKYAAEVEAKKPAFQWKVEFQIIERKRPNAVMSRYADDDGDGDDNNWKFREVTKTAIAQDEATAWAMVCDKMGDWPSPRLAKPRFTKLKQVSP
jgi:hypothetical protein